MAAGGILKRLAIEPGEMALFGWGTLTLFLVGWADVSVKNVSETFFLKRVGPEMLPVVFLVNSVLLVGTTYFFARLITGRDRLRLLPLTLVGLAGMLLPLWLLVRLDSTSVLALLVIASKQLTSIALLVFWVAIGDLMNARQAKRLFPLLMVGVTLGTIVGSFASKPLGDVFGIDGLLPMASVILVLCAAATLPLRRLRPARLERGWSVRLGSAGSSSSGGPGEATPSLRSLMRESGLFRLLFVPAICSGIVGPMLYFEFSYVANLSTGEGEEQLLQFYSQFRGWISVAVLVAQLGLTTNLYRWIGVPLSAALSPIVYFIGFVGLGVRLSLVAGVGAAAGTKLADNAVYDPALRVLFNLFPESQRPIVTALLEGPVKRAGGVLGNIVTLAALYLGSVAWVSFTALPVAVVWLVAALMLWRAYPSLLLRAFAGRTRRDDALTGEELIDSATLRALTPELVAEDPERCRLAIDLVVEARPERAVGALAEAARSAPDATRSLLIAALDQLLEGSVATPVANLEASRSLASLVEGLTPLSNRDRTDVIQAIGRLSHGIPDAVEPLEILQRAVSDPVSGVRTAAAAALCRRDLAPPDTNLDGLLATAAESDDELTRRVAREELRAVLLASEPDEQWGVRLSRLASLLVEPLDRAAAAQAVADIAQRHGANAIVAAEGMLRLRENADPQVRAAVMRFVGFAGLQGEASWLVEHVAASDYPGAESVRSAACEALTSLGSAAADVLLVELSCGKKSTRDAILPIVRQLEVEEETLRTLYGRELESLRRNLAIAAALQGTSDVGILLQRLDERVAESTHTALLLLAAIRDDDSIGELAELLLRADPRQRAILLEALDSLLNLGERSQLMPLLDVRGAGAAATLGIPVPSLKYASRSLLEDPDDLTRALAVATFDRRGNGAALARNGDLKDDRVVLSPVEIMLHLKSLPIFENLTTRQLMDLAKVVREEVHPPGTLVVTEGDSADCMYLIVEGEVEIIKGETLLRTMGPGSFFGEMAIFEGAPRSATVKTQTRVRLLGLEQVDLFRMMEELPAIAITVCRTMSRRVRQLTERSVGP